jgi:hypothetical protein
MALLASIMATLLVIAITLAFAVGGERFDVKSLRQRPRSGRL